MYDYLNIISSLLDIGLPQNGGSSIITQHTGPGRVNGWDARTPTLAYLSGQIQTGLHLQLKKRNNFLHNIRRSKIEKSVIRKSSLFKVSPS